MRVATFAVLFVLMSIYILTGLAGEVFTDRAVREKSMFVVLLVGTIVTGLATIGITVNVPD